MFNVNNESGYTLILRVVNGPCIIEIDRIVIRDVQYQFEVNRCRNEEVIVKGNFGWAWSMWPGRPRIDRIVIRDVQYQFEVNRCRNEEVIVKGNFGWAWSMRPGAPQVEIDRIVIRDVQYQFEVNRCRNEEVIVKGNLGWAWSMRAGRPRIDRIVIRDVKYQFKINGCRNEEVYFQGSSAFNVEGDSGLDGRTDRRTDGGDSHNIPTFLKKHDEMNESLRDIKTSMSPNNNGCNAIGKASFNMAGRVLVE
ncbi:hypothetical protein DPMN_167669 [Dreissena polymorpha]|uniref:Uncharacterized protein n=1 Tax=Dreissena polymorpha TaxID=45954 RepID=A0A9D4F0P4_DREPO|nr:hypothetical protein DPMN_167669 [Dreissena polymorpha]